jgi:hypothetical protein
VSRNKRSINLQKQWRKMGEEKKIDLMENVKEKEKNTS